MRRTAPLAFAALLALSAGAALAQDTANLGPTFKQGSKARYELINTAAQVISAPQGEMTVDVKSTLVLACEVVEVTEQGAKVVATLEAVKSDMQAPMFSASFDSATPPEQDASNQIASFVRPVVGKSFTVSFDATGSNANVSGVDALLPADPQIASVVAQAIGAQGLGTAVVGFYVLKDGMDPIAEGESWTDTQTAPAEPLGAITITTNSKLEDVEPTIARVAVDGNAVFTASPAAAAQGVSIAINDASIDGVILWSMETDMLQSLTSNSTMQIVMNNAQMPGVQQTMRITNTTSARRLD